MLSKEEKKLLSDISAEDAWSNVEYLSTLDKTSGTEGEWRAHEFVREKLVEYGVPYKEYAFDALISHPKEASLRVVSPSVEDVECITHAFSKTTPPGGYEAELVYVPLPPTGLFTAMEGVLEEYEKVGVEGKIPIIQGIANPAVVLAAEQAGAIAQIHICSGKAIHEMIVTTVWGTPSAESSERIPDFTAVSVKASAGEKLLALLEKGPVKVKVEARSETKWRKIPNTVAEIPGAEEPDKFILVHGHMDSWYLGTTDNCTGNAALLELARVLWKHRTKLKRGVRVAWWSGHSTGRYAGSTWYADNLFHELDRDCVLSMNIDSPGVKGASELGGGGLMGTMELIRQAVVDTTGEKDVASQAYYMRAGDQSFYGIGIPSIAVRAYIPDGHPLKGKWIGGSGGGWWWHSAYDTLDKGDKENLFRDMKMEALAIYRSMNSPLLPFDFIEMAAQYEEVVTEIQTHTASGTFNLNPVLDRVRALKVKAEALNEAITGNKELSVEETRPVDALLMDAAKTLLSTFYTYAGRYDQDPAYTLLHIPGLQKAKTLAVLEPGSDEAGFMATTVLREMNRVIHILDDATCTLDRALRLIGG
jgi:hypothetical protein